MAGIYIHIPFCKQACYYCNFHFSTSLRQKDEMMDCLCKELLLHASVIRGENMGMRLPREEQIETLYFGGGTPSILESAEIKRLITAVSDNYTLAGDAEITLEANPDDITPGKLRRWKESGINRLSVGIQSFDDENLKWMNRAHDASQAIRSLTWIKEAGFSNYSVDLIFGIPHLTDEKWISNIDRVIAAGAPHIACYALTVEPKTALAGMIRLGKKEDVNQEDQARQFEILMTKMHQAGYEHYETSNFALAGFRSRHNSSYWQQKRYLGIGPSAHSFDGENRYWNIANNPLYIKAINDGALFFEHEHLTPAQQFDEYIMTGLRTIEGVSLEQIRIRFGNDVYDKTIGKLKTIPNDWIDRHDENIFLTDRGKLFTDRISVDLFA